MADLNTKIQFMKGVGPKIGAKLNKLGLETAGDILFYYPRNYLDFTRITKIADIRSNEGEKVTIQGRILGISNKRTSRRRFTVTEAVVEDNTGSIKVIWFNQPFLLKMLPAGREVILHGKIDFNFYTREVVMESPVRTLFPRIEPIYGETAGLTSKYISKLVSSLKSQIFTIEEYLPDYLLCHSEADLSAEESSEAMRPIGLDPSPRQVGTQDDKLLGIQEALQNIHFPQNSEMLEKSRRRIAFDELFMISLRANLSKEEIKKENAPVISDKKEGCKEFESSLPFELTGDQAKTTRQILDDMKKNVPMNRLLNGDVGSGKTAVAAIAAYVAVKAGYRVAVMCPTSILASQHFETFCNMFKNFDIGVGLYTRERKERSIMINPLAGEQKSKSHYSSFPAAAGSRHGGDIIHNSNIIIGTQALIQEGVDLENLGLVIVDEQHRFGVKQRGALLSLQSAVSSQQSDQKTANCQLPTTNRMRPHFLSMTATPIPRTLHLALFGDLDISVIKEKPKDRKEIKTRFVLPQNRNKAYEFIRAHLKAGRQAFVVCPLIEETENSESEELALFGDERKTVKVEYEKLQKIYPEFKINMLHGKMKAKEKDEIMAEFMANRTQILVSTSVVEVGVDVPNATIMVIEDAERFGLAQIHQFRGRVGRAEHQSFCLLFSPTMSEKALHRLRSLEATSDGFRLAEIDLETRGPGAVFGTEQSGLLDLKMANFSDRELIEEASNAAKLVVESDPELKNHPLLKEKIADYLQNKHLE